MIVDNTARIGTFGQGFTSSGYPMATAVAPENLTIIEEQNVVQRAAEVSPLLQQSLRELENHALVGEGREIDLIAAADLVADKKSKANFNPQGRIGTYFSEYAHRHGLTVRNIGDSIALCPSLIITSAEIHEMLVGFTRGFRGQ